MTPCSDKRCSGCPGSGHVLINRPAKAADIAVVFDAPNEEQAKHGRWFAGKRGGQMELLRMMLESHTDVDELYLCSAINCFTNPKKKAMQKKQMLACADRLVDELLEAGVSKVLCIGPIGYGAIMGATKLPAITKVRGRWMKAHGMDVLATLPPGFAIGQPEYFRDIDFDLTKFFHTDGREPDPNIDLWIPETPSEVDDAFSYLWEFDYIAADIETTGFSFLSDSLTCMGLGVLVNERDAKIVILNEDALQSRKTWRRIGKLINDPRIELIWHNMKFDLKFMKRQLELRGMRFAPANVHDTMMLHYALDERPMGKYKPHGLEVLARCRYDSPDYSIDMTAFLAQWNDSTISDEVREELRLKLHKYLGLDVYYTARLYPDLWNAALEEDERLLDLYERLFLPGTIALMEVEYHGIYLDSEMYARTAKELDRKADELLIKIRERVNKPDFNPGSPKQVKQYVYDELGLTPQAGIDAAIADVQDISSRDEGIRSRGTYTDPSRLLSSPTAAPVLRTIARGYPEHAEWLIDICEWRNLTKNAGTYVKGLLRRMDVDGRIHGSFNIHGTASGRLSSTDPNLQNMPPASHVGIAIRSGFMAPPGMSIIDADYKQLEVRVAAELSHDPAMKELFDSGGDPHAETSHIIYGREDVSHYERMLGKIITFGLLYGRSPNSIAIGPEAEDIAARGGKRWGPNEVREFFDNLLSKWAVYAKWRQNCRETPYKEGEITFSIGRKRRFHFVPKHDGGHVGRQGINTPCQGTASDFCLWAVIRLNEVLKPYDAHVISTVHDSILIECPDEHLDEVIPLVERTMEEDTLWETYIPLKVDLKVTKRWGEDDDMQYAGQYLEAEVDEAAF